MTDLFTSEAVVAFIQVVAIDLVLAGDNAVVIGLAAAGLPTEQRTRAILIGIVGATVLRIVLAGLTTQLLQIVGLLFAGGILLLWVCWKIWRELRTITDLPMVSQHKAIGTSTVTEPSLDVRAGRHLGRRRCKSSRPMCRCRWTMFWP